MNAVMLALLAWGQVAPPAQSWSPAQQEIIEQIRRCNDAWVASHVDTRFEVYDSVCPATEQAVFWYIESDTPVTYKGEKGWANSIRVNRSVSWRDLRPVAVQIDGDMAYAYYSVTWLPEPNTGPVEPRHTRRLTVFQRRNGRWLMAGGSIARVNP